MTIEYVRIITTGHTPTPVSLGGEAQLQWPADTTQTSPPCTILVALENRATVFLTLYLKRLSLMAHTGGMHLELYRLMLRCEINVSLHLHNALKP